MAYKPKTIYLIRHAQSQYNAYMHSPLNWLTFRCCFDPKIYDPLLSPKGEGQAKKLYQKLLKESLLQKIDLVVTSPLIRSIQTALFAFPLTSRISQLTTRTQSHSPLQEPLLAEPPPLRPDSPMGKEPIHLDQLELSSGLPEKSPSSKSVKPTSPSYSTFKSSSDEKEDSKKKLVPQKSSEDVKKKSRPRCKATFYYEAAADGELTFATNDIIFIKARDDSGWWQGEHPNGSIGWFPSNFVEEIEPLIVLLPDNNKGPESNKGPEKPHSEKKEDGVDLQQKLNDQESKIKLLENTILSEQKKNGSLQKRLEQETAKNMCTVCTSASRDTVLMPCMHFLYCMNCLSKGVTKCPACRVGISGKIQCLLQP